MASTFTPPLMWQLLQAMRSNNVSPQESKQESGGAPQPGQPDSGDRDRFSPTPVPRPPAPQQRQRPQAPQQQRPPTPRPTQPLHSPVTFNLTGFDAGGDVLTPGAMNLLIRQGLDAVDAGNDPGEVLKTLHSWGIPVSGALFERN